MIYKNKLITLKNLKENAMFLTISEASNRYTHLFLVERQYFGFNTLESVIVE
jgi:hypothetical protein